MACEVCYGFSVRFCPCCSPETGDNEEAEAEAEEEAILRARRDDPLWSRLEAAGYSVIYDYDGSQATFESAEKVIRKVTRTARRDHRDGKVKAGQRYVETLTRIIDYNGCKRHEIYKRVIR